jgi:outer membrane autotransporter protein
MASPYACSGRFWMTGFGGSFEHDGSSKTFDQDIDQWGVAAGYSWQYSPSLTLGLMAGYFKSDLEVDAEWGIESHDIDSDGWFAGFFGEQDMGAYYFDLGITGGMLSHDHSRFVNDNLALTNGLTLGESYADADYDSWFLAPEAGIGMDIDHGNGLVFTPSARIRYAWQSIDGYTESGSNANAKVGDRDIGMIEASVEMAAAKQVDFGTLTGRIGYLLRENTGDDSVSINMIGVKNSVGYGDTDSDAAYLGLAARVEISPNTDLVLDGQGYFSGDISGYQGMAKLAVSF